MPRCAPHHHAGGPSEDTRGGRCNADGCHRQGLYPAPRSRLDMNNRFWFCLEHVRAYNKSWNYLDGLSAAEIEAEIRKDSVGRRPTWPFSKLGSGGGYTETEQILFPHLRESVKAWYKRRAKTGRTDTSGNKDGRGQQQTNGRQACPDHAPDGFREAAHAVYPQTRAQKDACSLLALNKPFDRLHLKDRFKTLAKTHHPDLNPGDRNASERFRSVCQAYETLSAMLAPEHRPDPRT